MKKILLYLLILTTFFTGAAAESVLPGDGTAAAPEETVLFVATDRHAAYETAKEGGDGVREEMPPEEIDKVFRNR
jgi:hypothetical protein